MWITLNLPRFRGHLTVGAVEPRRGSARAEPQAAPYPAEFRAVAIRLAHQLGHFLRSIRSIAMELGISNESLRRRVIQVEIDLGDSPGLASDERAELTRLRRGRVAVHVAPFETDPYWLRSSSSRSAGPSANSRARAGRTSAARHMRGAG